MKRVSSFFKNSNKDKDKDKDKDRYKDPDEDQDEDEDEDEHDNLKALANVIKNYDDPNFEIKKIFLTGLNLPKIDLCNE